MRLNVTNILGSSGSTAIQFNGLTHPSFLQTPRFCARLVSATKIGSSTARVIRYETVDINVGNGYNSANGRFTAPQLGLYFISFHMVTNAGGPNRTQSFISRNGIYYIESTQEATPGSGIHQRTLSASCLMYLDLNAYVEIVSTADTAANDGWNTFSGYYIGV